MYWIFTLGHYYLLFFFHKILKCFNTTKNFNFKIKFSFLEKVSFLYSSILKKFLFKNLIIFIILRLVFKIMQRGDLKYFNFNNFKNFYNLSPNLPIYKFPLIFF